MTARFDLSVLIGRFQPFHNGHLQIVRSALENADQVLILIGSSNLARTTRNPFTYQERSDMVSCALDDVGLLSRVQVLRLPDNPYDNAAWCTKVQKKVASEIEWLQHKQIFGTDVVVAITGHDRDQSSFYLKKFPQWEFQPPTTDLLHINATALRNNYLLHGDKFGETGGADWLPPASYVFLKNFAQTDRYYDLAAEYDFELKYREQWGSGPFQTVDSVVIQSGHVLVVKRKNRPGRGLYAVPGGHLNLYEPLDEAAVRELWEETKIFEPGYDHGFTNKQRLDFVKKELWPHYRARRRFDNPHRSTRAHVITETFLFKLPDAQTFPEVVGSDDAEEALWLPLSEMEPTEFFEDHAFIIRKMLSYLS